MRRKASSHFCLCLLVLVSFSVSLVGCNQVPPPSQADLVKIWIQQHAIPFTTAEPGGSSQDLLPLKQIVGNASIVGLGEATHGTHEFFAMKERILEFLVNEMGFNTFAIEDSWDTAHQIDAYVMTGKGNARDALKLLPIVFWNTQELLDLIEWVHTYNANPAHTSKVHFTGFDCQTLTASPFDQVLAYVTSVDPQQTSKVQRLYAGIRPPEHVLENSTSYEDLTQDELQQNIDAAQSVYDLLKNHQAEYEGHSSQQAFALALQNARVIVQYSELQPASSNTSEHYLKYVALRDAFMAENVGWLHEHAGSHVKMVLWAHNVHIANDPVGAFEKVKTMGAYLHEQYQKQYLPIGFSFYQGSFNASSSGGLQVFTVGAPATDSYNYTLGSVHLSQYILDLRTIPNGPVGDWVQGQSYLRSIAAFDPKDENNHGDYVLGSLQGWYDVIIHFQKITPSHLLP